MNRRRADEVLSTRDIAGIAAHRRGPVPSAGGRRGQAADSVTDATADSIELLPEDVLSPSKPRRSGREEPAVRTGSDSRSSDDRNSAPEAGTSSTASSTSRSPSTSEKLGEPSGGSNRPPRVWPRPRNAREFAAQANKVATMILNDEIEPEKGARYVSAARVTVQALSTEVTRARFLQREPDLSLDTDDDFDEEGEE